MVRASIAAGVACRRRNIRRGYHPRVRSQGRVHIVGIDGDLPARRVAGHVLVDHGQHLLAGRLVVGEDGLGAEQSALFAGVEVELERVLGLKARAGQDPERLENDDDAGTVVVGAGAAGRGGAAR